MTPPSGDDLWNLDAFLDAGPATTTAACKCKQQPLGPGPTTSPGDDPLLAFLDAPSQLCGCAAGCSCSCMDWLEELPSSPRGAAPAPAFSRPPFRQAMLLVPPASTAPLRCLDNAHPQACTVCAQAPAQDEEAGTELFARDGKTGEKRLRALLTRTPEWNSPAIRDQAAIALLAERGTPTGIAAADALRKRESGRLRKCDLLFLARRWRYRSDVWRPRQQRPLARRPTARNGAPAAAVKREVECSGAVNGVCRCAATNDLALGALLDTLAAATAALPASGPAPSSRDTRAVESLAKVQGIAAHLRAASATLMVASPRRAAGDADQDAPLWRLGQAFTDAEAQVDILCAHLCGRAAASAGDGAPASEADVATAKLARAAKANFALLAMQPSSGALGQAHQLLMALAALAERSGRRTDGQR